MLVLLLRVNAKDTERISLPTAENGMGSGRMTCKMVLDAIQLTESQ